MKSTWILVADSSRARVFTAETPSSPLQEIDDLAHPAGRLHEQRMTSDLPGKDNGNIGVGGHSYQDQTGPKEQEAIDFAKRVSEYLEDGKTTNRFEQLLIISAPAFLGTLRTQLSAQTRNCICFELDKNITTHSADDIRRHLPENLPSL